MSFKCQSQLLHTINVRIITSYTSSLDGGTGRGGGLFCWSNGCPGGRVYSMGRGDAPVLSGKVFAYVECSKSKWCYN